MALCYDREVVLRDEERGIRASLLTDGSVPWW